MQRLLVVLVAGALVAGVVALTVGEGAYAFKIGDREVSQRDVDDELEAIAENEALLEAVELQTLQNPRTVPLSRVDGSITAEYSAGLVGLRIRNELVTRELERLDVEATVEDRRNARTLVGQAFGGPEAFAAMPVWLRERLLARWTDVAVLQRVLFECPTDQYVSHILVETAAEAQDVRARLDAGTDFAELAEAASLDQGSAALGGELGCLAPESFVEPFQAVAEGLPLGVVSDPVETEFGFHLILVRDELTSSQLALLPVEEVLGRARGTRVQVDPRYGRWDVQTGQLLPPSGPSDTG